MYALREFACCRCGDPVRKRAPAGSEQRCIVCTVEVSADAIRQLHLHSGPAWDAWSAGMHRATGCPLADLTAEDLARVAAAMRSRVEDPRSPSPAA